MTPQEQPEVETADGKWVVTSENPDGTLRGYPQEQLEEELRQRWSKDFLRQSRDYVSHAPWCKTSSDDWHGEFGCLSKAALDMCDCQLPTILDILDNSWGEP